MTTRRLGTALAIPVLAAGLLTTLSPAASAQAGETRQVPVTHSCIGLPYPNPNEVLRDPPSWIPSGAVSTLRPLIQTATFNTSEIRDTVTVTAPERAEPGEQFTVRLQPGAMSRDREVSRLHYDFRVPAGADLINYRIVPGTAQGLSGTPALTRVNAAGQQSDNGEFLRLSGGNQTVNNRPAWDRTLNNAGGWGDGLRAPENGRFRLPAIELTLTAEDGSTVTTGLRTGPVTPVAGQDASTAFLSEFNTYSINRKILFWSIKFEATVGHANYCSATGLGRQALSTTRVHSVYQTATDVEVQLEALTGDEVAITAEVTPNPGRGTVEFYDGEDLIGQDTVSEDGTAELVWRFRDRGTHQITARYVGDAEYLSSESEPRTVEVTVPGEVVIEPEPEEPVDPVFPDPKPGLLGSLTGSLGN
ncbi:Ig-like domain repeat protein [Dietzia maris]|nr:Ig-like domain repeat protein [Dietzia maris]